jgi:molecular chaperone GrpE
MTARRHTIPVTGAAGEADLASPGPAAQAEQQPGEVPAGEPEAPVGPTAPIEDPQSPGPPVEDPEAPGSPAEEPNAPESPSRPHGDELGEEAIPAEPDGRGEAPGAAGEAESEDHERNLERDLEELTAKADKADEYLELAQRTKADFENYRRRAAREAAAAQDRGVAKLARELLPAVDNLDRALQAAEAQSNGQEAENTLVSGIKLVHQDVIAALARVGIQPYSPQGEPFDPQHHEAVAQQPVEGAQPGTVVEVYQCGYRLGESVLRPARVVVAA